MINQIVMKQMLIKLFREEDSIDYKKGVIKTLDLFSRILCTNMDCKRYVRLIKESLEEEIPK